MNISGIYKISSIRYPKKIYIGSAVNIKNRWRGHMSFLRSNKHANRKLQNHYNKYGKDDLIFDFIVGCPSDELLKNEQFFIDLYDPWFNISKTAGSILGMKFSEETKKKMSIKSKGNKYALGFKHTDETRKRMSDAGKLKVFTEEHKRKLSEGQMGVKNHRYGTCPLEETRQKLSKALVGNKRRLGKKQSKEARQKISASNRGRVVTDETRLKISKSHIGIKQTPESREKLRINHLGKRPTLDTRRKMSQSHKLAWANRKKKTA